MLVRMAGINRFANSIMHKKRFKPEVIQLITAAYRFFINLIHDIIYSLFYLYFGESFWLPDSIQDIIPVFNMPCFLNDP
jgi:hypothetical protein